MIALAGAVIADGGLSAFGSSTTGHRLIAEIALTLLAIPLLLDRGRFAAGQRPGVVHRWLGRFVALGLVVTLAASSHASSQPTSRRDLVLAVYSVHLLAVSIWLGALLAVVIRLGLPKRADGPDPARTLRPLVAGSLLAVLASGVATTDWGLRTLHDVPDTLYGQLALTKISLFALIVAIGATASWFQLRRGRRRIGGWLVGLEAVVAAATLIVAGVLGQISQPLDQPYASQAYASDAGLPVTVSPGGEEQLVIGTLAPGIVGRNTIVVEDAEAGVNDFLSPASGVHSITASISCGCGLPDQRVALRRTAGATWSGDVTLSRAATWLVAATVHRHGEKPQPVQLAERVTPAQLPDQVVVGVPASFSGPDAETCRDQVLGLQVALADLNSSAADHGDLMRVVAVDLHDGALGSALSQLRARGARVLALPCGTPQQVSALTAGAHRAGLPVVLGSTTSDPTVGDGVWSTQPSWDAEGAAIAAEAAHQDASTVTAVVGRTSVDQAELTGLRTGLARAGIGLRVSGFPSNPHRFVASLANRGVEQVAMLGDPGEALPLVQELSTVQQSSGWLPPRGILASAQLMSTDFINAAGTITRLGGIEFASDVNPFDPVSQYYASRLRTLAPGLRPSFNGLHGYQAGLAIAAAFRDGGGVRRPRQSRRCWANGSRTSRSAAIASAGTPAAEPRRRWRSSGRPTSTPWRCRRLRPEERHHSHTKAHISIPAASNKSPRSGGWIEAGPGARRHRRSRGWMRRLIVTVNPGRRRLRC